MAIKKIRKQDALNYHMQGQPGKIEVVPTKALTSQLDLALAYSPGVAEPCKEIAANIEDVYKYTSKGNLVAVISNGTAVLGLGNIGPQASKPGAVRPPARPRKRSYKEEREHEALPGRIAALEAEQQRLQEEVAGPDFYKAGKAHIDAVLARIDGIHAELEQALARWVELEEIGS